MNKTDWVWMPHAGHLIVGNYCRFHLNTFVPAADGGGFIVSTVGEYMPDSVVRDIMAQTRGVQLEGRGDAREADFLNKMGFVEIGYERLYETMVFRASLAAPAKGEDCCPWRQVDGRELDTMGYMDPGAAYRGHLALCQKWDGANMAEQSGDEDADIV